MDYGFSKQSGGIMAVVRLADYYKGHVKRVSYVVAGMIIAVNLALTFILLQFHYSLLMIAIYVLLPVIFLEVFSLFIILRYALEPLEILTRAVTYVSPQQSNVTPPHVNDPRHQVTGLKEMVQVIYERKEQVAKTLTTTDMADLLPSGIIAFDTAGKIVYHNTKAPVQENADKEQQLTLQFLGNDTPQNWLTAVREKKLRDIKLWQGIEDKPLGEEGRHLYDVVGYYEKNSPHKLEVIMVTIDRTENYVEDEEAIDFISLAAHELRGPITVIRGYIDVLTQELQPMIKGDQQELMDRLDVSAARLSNYINNILNVAKYDRRHLKLHLVEDRLSTIYSAIADDLQLRARTQGKLLDVEIPTDLPTIAADRNSLSEVLANLVDNALKYSREGGHVQVTARTDGSSVICSVKDHGIGIPSSVMGHLFSKFYRSHRSRATVSGTGLGLYISKAIIESHGGQISANSSEGEGATFTFTVPTYDSVRELLSADENANASIIHTSSGWIRNHNKFGG